MLNDEFEYYDRKRQFATAAVQNFAALSDEDSDDLIRRDEAGNILPGRCACIITYTTDTIDTIDTVDRSDRISAVVSRPRRGYRSRSCFCLSHLSTGALLALPRFSMRMLMV